MAGNNPDIRDKILQTNKHKITSTQPVEQNQFIPEIPSAVLDTALPPELISALDHEYEVSKSVINSGYERIDKSAQALQEANKEITSAQNRLQEIDGNIGLEFIGIFDKDYNRNHQKSRINNAKYQLEMTTKQLDLQAMKDQLRLKEAGLETQTYTKMLEFQTQKMNMSAAQANAIIQSNAARKQVKSLLQNEYTHEELIKMHETGNYDDVWTAQEVSTYITDYQTTQMEMEAKKLANQQNRTKLAEQLETRALNSIPIPWAKSLLSQAEKEKTSLIKIPGTNTTVPRDKLRNSIATRMKTQEDSYKTIAASSLELAKNEGNLSTALSNVSSISSLWAENGQTVDNLNNMNLLNMTEDTVNSIPISSIHPAIRSEFQNLTQAVTTINSKQEDNQPVTTQDMYTLREVINTINAKSEQVQKDLIDSAEDKGSKAALKEWFANGKMQNQDNSASMLVANSISLPNLSGDQALEASYQVMLENVASEVVDENIDWSALDPEERTNLIFSQLLEKDFRGKVENRDKILKAMNKKNHQGLTPVEAYAANRSAEIMVQALTTLREKYPEYSDYFQALGRATNYQNIPAIAASLAELSYRVRQKNPNSPSLLFNQEMVDIMGQIIDKNKQQWNSQLNPVRGSFMNLMFNVSPGKLVDDSLTTSFGSTSRRAWDELEQHPVTENEKARRRVMNQNLRAYGQQPMENTPEYSPVELPSNLFE